MLGNISRDLAVYQGNRRFELLGGAALHVARAASSAGLPAAPVSVIGTDLGWIRSDPRLADLDLTAVRVIPGSSCAFTLTYTAVGALADIDCSFGVAERLTGHCLATIGDHGQYHVCGRRPLHVRAVLGRLARADLTFSIDFHLASAGELINESADFLADATLVFVNATEFAILADLADTARMHGIVVSDGPRAVTLLRHGSVTAAVRPPDAHAVEVTGAGDALAGTFLASLAHGMADADALRAAVAAATRSIQSPGLVIGEG